MTYLQLSCIICFAGMLIMIGLAALIVMPEREPKEFKSKDYPNNNKNDITGGN